MEDKHDYFQDEITYEFATGQHTKYVIGIAKAKFAGNAYAVDLLSIRKWRRSKRSGEWYPLKDDGTSMLFGHIKQLIEVLQRLDVEYDGGSTKES